MLKNFYMIFHLLVDPVTSLCLSVLYKDTYWQSIILRLIYLLYNKLIRATSELLNVYVEKQVDPYFQ
jgi:hypothetical protein